MSTSPAWWGTTLLNRWPKTRAREASRRLETVHVHDHVGDFICLYLFIRAFVTVRFARVGPEASSLARLLNGLVTSYLHTNVARFHVTAVSPRLKETRWSRSSTSLGRSSIRGLLRFEKVTNLRTNSSAYSPCPLVDWPKLQEARSFAQAPNRIGLARIFVLPKGTGRTSMSSWVLAAC